MPKPEYTGSRNALNDAGWQELARLVQSGTDTRKIARLLGLSRNHASMLAKRARDALGIKHHLVVQREALVARIGELLSAGGTNHSVAAALGVDRKAVSLARRQLGLAQPTHLRLDEHEYAEIDRRLIAGERISAIARDMSVTHSTVWKRQRAISDRIPTDFPPCRCGRIHNHHGACRLMPEKIQQIRDQLAAGRRMEWIAPEIGISVRALRDYALPIIAELRAAGVKCGCGREISHVRPYCREAHAKVGRKRPSKCHPRLKKPMIVDPALERRMLAHWRRGASLDLISSWSGVAFSTLQRLNAFWTSRKTKPGQPCVCGRPFRHPGGCIRNTPGAVSDLEAKRMKRHIAAGLLPHKIAEVMNLTVATVMRHTLDQREQLLADGITCDCGRRIAHVGWCSAKWDAWDMPRGFRPLAANVRRQVRTALLRGDVVADIAAAAGIGADRVWGERREMSVEDRRERALAIRARIRRDDINGEHLTNAIEMALPIDFGSLLPRGLLSGDAIAERNWLAGSIRAGVINELYLAVTEGRVEIEQIPDVVRSFVGRGLSEWTSLGAKSLDASLGAEGTATLGDLVGDMTASSAIDEIEIGQPPP